MSTFAPRLVPVFIALLACSSALSSMAPLTDEDVVRMLVSGSSVDTVLRDINEREPAFDLSDEMVDELRRAGVPDRVLRAMRRRQGQHDAARRELRETAEPGDDRAVLRVTLDPQRGDRSRILKAAKEVDPVLRAQWELGNAPEEHVFADMAVFVACRTADHVPHQWRGRSPLGQDFISMPRHRMLALVGGASGQESRTLRLQLPEWLEANVANDETHDLMVGIAMHVGGRYLRLADARRDGWLPERDGTSLTVRIRGRGLPTYVPYFVEN